MKLLLLAGTQEARQIAARLSGDGRVEVLASLAGATRAPVSLEVPVRVGGFGGAIGLQTFLEDNGFHAILDATHPFARVMPGRAQDICARLGLPYLRVLRPGWRPGRGDRWQIVPDERATALAIEALAIEGGARVFLATGRRSLPRFAALAQGRHLVARVIDPPKEPFPFLQGAWVVGRPPFTVESEMALFRAHRIDVLVAKNAGGPTDAKLAAARALGLPVVLIDRPMPPPGAQVATVEAALAWLEAHL